MQKNGTHLHARFKCGYSYWLCLVRHILPPRVDGIFTSSKQAAKRNPAVYVLFCFAFILTLPLTQESRLRGKIGKGDDD